jgi:hypothetical protein
MNGMTPSPGWFHFTESAPDSPPQNPNLAHIYGTHIYSPYTVQNTNSPVKKYDPTLASTATEIFNHILKIKNRNIGL